MELENMFRGIGTDIMSCDGRKVFGSGIVFESDYFYIVKNDPYFRNEFGDTSPLGIKWFKVHKSSIAMNTGLKDSTTWEQLTKAEQINSGETKETWEGKPIYGSIKLDGEMTRGGDIVRIDNKYNINYTGVIEYCESTAMFWHHRHYVDNAGINKSYHEDIRNYLNEYYTISVIGNAFQNPELLE